MRGGRIVATGSDEDVREVCGPRREVVDLRGRLLVPGFQDAHVHASAGGLDRMRVDLSESHTRDEYARIVTAYAAAHPEGRGSGGRAGRSTCSRAASPRGNSSTRSCPIGRRTW